MKCPTCGNEMVLETRDETLSFGSESLTLHGMIGYFCPECVEGVWDEQSYKRYTAAQDALINSARENIPADIRRIRRNLKLSQGELAKIFGVGKVAFSRYERGETNPPAPVIKLLKLVERHPDLLSEVSSIKASTPEKRSGASKGIRRGASR